MAFAARLNIRIRFATVKMEVRIMIIKEENDRRLTFSNISARSNESALLKKEYASRRDFLFPPLFLIATSLYAQIEVN